VDRFRTMESFVRVVRAGSFTIAASQLGLSRALVSRHVGDLEGRLGVRLLNRSTRSLALTEEGTAYLEFCERVFRDIESNERSILRTRLEPAGTLKLLAPKSFGALHLSDAVIAFEARSPRRLIFGQIFERKVNGPSQAASESPSFLSAARVSAEGTSV